MGLIRDSFIIFKNWAEAINTLPEEYQLETYKALVEYGTTGKIPQKLSSVANAMLISFSVGMENSLVRYVASVKNGKMGGRPREEKVSKEALKKREYRESKQTNQDKPNSDLDKPRTNLTEPRQTKTNQDEPRTNLNVNVNVNDNLIDKYKNINIHSARTREELIDCFLNRYDDFFKCHPNDKFSLTAKEIIGVIADAVNLASTQDGLKFNNKIYRRQEFCDLLKELNKESFDKIVSKVTFKTGIKNRVTYILTCVINEINTNIGE